MRDCSITDLPGKHLMSGTHLNYLDWIPRPPLLPPLPPLSLICTDLRTQVW